MGGSKFDVEYEIPTDGREVGENSSNGLGLAALFAVRCVSEAVELIVSIEAQLARLR